MWQQKKKKNHVKIKIVNQFHEKVLFWNIIIFRKKWKIFPNIKFREIDSILLIN